VNNTYGTATSANAALTVNTPPVITAQPQNQTVLAGSSATFSVTATGSTPLAYQWRLNGTNIPGATSSSYTRANVQPGNAGSVTAVITNGLGAVTSSPAALTVNLSLVVSATSGGTVAKSPNQPSYAPGAIVTLTASHPTFMFTGWSGNGSGTNNPLAVTMTTNLNVTANFASPVADLIVDNPQAVFTGTWATDTSAADKYNSDYRSAGSVGGSATGTGTYTPTISTAGFYDVYVWTPTVARGAAATPVLIAGNGTNISVTVDQSSGSGGWQLIASGVPFAQGMNGYVRFANNAGQGGNKDVVADAVRWSYSGSQSVAPPVVTAPPTNVTVVAGAPAGFSVGAGGTAPLTYQWRRNGNSIANATNAGFNLASAQPSDAGDYTVVVANSVGSVTSSVATLTILVPPQIVSSPQSRRVKLGHPATFNVSASGSAPLTYQWRFNTQIIAGATSNSLNLTNVQVGSAGDYDVVVSNPAGSATSPAAELVVSVPPVLSSPLLFAGVVRFNLSGTPGDWYLVESSTNLVNWGGNVALTNLTGEVLFVDPESASLPTKFYRGKLGE
jgi:hypothetical protein